jgi:hypothetical protein
MLLLNMLVMAYTLENRTRLPGGQVTEGNQGEADRHDGR